MYTQIAATYSPDYHVIRLKSEFPAFSDTVTPQGFQTPQQVGFFIHEWLHYLHNISTIHGIAAYSHAVILWSNVRPTIDHNGLCMGDEHLEPSHFADIRKQFKHRLNARAAQTNKLKHGLHLSDIEFTSCNKETTLIEDDKNYPCSILACSILIRPNGETDDIKIGCHEIVEYIAFALESKFLRHLKKTPFPVPIDPYLLVKGLASFLSPTIVEETILRCAILSLQYPDPPYILANLLAWAEKKKIELIDPDIELARIASNHLTSNIHVMEESVGLIEDMFPLDEPFPRAIKNTAESIRKNYLHRITDPFFEIGLVEEFAKFGGIAINAAMEKYGVGFLIQERSGPDDQFMRDVMLDISTLDKQDPEISCGRRVAQAAFTYIFEFFRSEPDRLRQPRTMRCPFFTTCGADYRRDNPNICNSEPWLSQNLKHSEMCYFGRAVINTKNLKPA